VIVVHKIYKGGADPVLAYDADSGELWGHPNYWSSNLNLVGLTEEEFAQFFDSHTLIAGKTDKDPFEDIPNAEELFRNYPPGSEEIPGVETIEPRPAVNQAGEGASATEIQESLDADEATDTDT